MSALTPSRRAIRPPGFRGIRWVIPAETKLGGYFEAYRNLFGTALVVRSLDAGRPTGALCYTLSILALDFAAIAGLVVVTPFEFFWATAALPVFGLVLAAVVPLPQTV